MRRLLEQLEEMHMRVAETASGEEALVKALGEALARLDEQLLDDVRHVAMEHEHRRTAILGELQGLASRIGMFQVARAHATPVELESPEPHQTTAGDWREATRKIAEEIEAATTPTHQHTAQTVPFPREPRRLLPSLAERRRRANVG